MKFKWKPLPESITEQFSGLFCEQRVGRLGCLHLEPHTYNLANTILMTLMYCIVLGIFFWPAVLGVWLTQLKVEP
jgi:hypothetical protein